MLITTNKIPDDLQPSLPQLTPLFLTAFAMNMTGYYKALATALAGNCDRWPLFLAL